MNKYRMILLLSTLLLACNQLSDFTIVGTPTATNIPTGTISGKVIDSSDGTFIPTASVSTEPPTSSVTTDEEGSFSIPDVLVGNYTVTAAKSGYTSVSVKIAVLADKTTTTDLHLIGNEDDNASVTPQSEVIPNDDLMAYYPFNGNADDESMNDNHGEVYGAVLTEDRFGNPESAYEFDGVDDRIEITDNSDINFSSGDFSIVGWLKTSHTHNDSNGQAIIDKYPQKGRPWTIRLQPDGKIRFISDASVYSEAVVNDGAWHQFVALRSNSTIKLFIDGQLQGTALSTTSASNSMLLCIGCIHDYSLRRLFKGTIDDIRIYSRALDETEIQLLYKESKN